MSSRTVDQPPAEPPNVADELATLETIQRRVLWLATLMIHHANHRRPNPDGTKIGGHQASSASAVSILTTLFFRLLEPGDRLSVKPHASPVLHALQYLLGQLPRAYLTELRAFGGLQAYPSRTKDPDRIDFSTGSVGLGAVAPAFAALGHHYTLAHFGSVTSRRFIALIGDAELDEGNVWEAVLEDALDGIDNLVWIVDLNRQSLDRVVPGIRATRLKQLFSANGWRVLEAKYGRQLQALFEQPHGDTLRSRIDSMGNEEYQALIRLTGGELRRRLAAGDTVLEGLLAGLADDELPGALANLGGHDVALLGDVLGQALEPCGKPTIVFAYTIKGWGLPIAGHPENHAMLLTDEQIETLRTELNIAPDSEWDAFDPASAAGQLCRSAGARVYAATHDTPALPAPRFPDALGSGDAATMSTQDAFGRALFRLAGDNELRERIVTASPDVSVSTNLVGWINRAGAFSLHPGAEAETRQALVRWKQSPSGQHIELGISEMNLFVLLGMLGLSAELSGQLTVPIGTVYDPFVCRGLDALIYAVYSGAKFIVAGTPSGVSLAPEGGAHQSTITPSVGIELPGLRSYEPCFGRELEWILLDSIQQCYDRVHGRPSYLRLSTKPIDQQLLQPARDRLGDTELRRQVLAGGYRLRDWRDGDAEADPDDTVYIVSSGCMAPEACAAAERLWYEGVAATVVQVTSTRRLYESWSAHARRASLPDPFAELVPAAERFAPVITLLDGASHALAWLGGVFRGDVIPLGVDAFGQSGTRNDLYHYYGIDDDAIVAAALDALDRREHA